jgi:hypothetical protein
VAEAVELARADGTQIKKKAKDIFENRFADRTPIEDKAKQRS